MTTIEILKTNGLSKTDIRLKVLDLFLKHANALSLQDIETSFEKVDRVTLYRTLKKFESKGIIHKALDGTTHPKYALCEGQCMAHNHRDHHPHFHCTKCEKTICLEDIKTPTMPTPKGYTIHETNVILSGVCDDCN